MTNGRIDGECFVLPETAFACHVDSQSTEGRNAFSQASVSLRCPRAVVEAAKATLRMQFVTAQFCALYSVPMLSLIASHPKCQHGLESSPVEHRRPEASTWRVMAEVKFEFGTHINRKTYGMLLCAVFVPQAGSPSPKSGRLQVIKAATNHAC